MSSLHKESLAHDHSLHAGQITLLRGDFKVAVDDAEKDVSTLQK